MVNSFYHVIHAFLLQVMEHFGFGPNFITWITSCISNPWITPLVNRRPTDFFQDNKGIHQVFPVCPLLFIIFVESLCKKLEQERENENLPGVQIA